MRNDAGWKRDQITFNVIISIAMITFQRTLVIQSPGVSALRTEDCT